MRSLSFSALLLAVIAGCASSSAPTPDSSASDLTSADGSKSITFSNFTKAVTDAQSQVAEGTGCTFDVTSTTDKVTLTLTTGKDAFVVDVPSTTEITSTSKGDGDATTDTYSFAGSGSVVFVDVSDAYNTVTLTDATKKTVTCEVDF